MKVQDLLQPLYLEANQQMGTLLLGDIGIINAINMALNDIYFYEGNHWGFMNTEETFELNETADYLKIETSKPIISLTGIFTGDELQENKFKVVYSKARVKSNSCNQDGGYVYHTSFGKELLIKNPKRSVTITYIGGFNRLKTKEDIIPLPDGFISALRNLSLFYILGPQGQYGEQKSGDLYNRGQEQLRQLSKGGLGQISSISFK